MKNDYYEIIQIVKEVQAKTYELETGERLDSNPEFGEEMNLNDFDSYEEGDVGFGDKKQRRGSRHSKGGATMKSLESEAGMDENQSLVEDPKN